MDQIKKTTEEEQEENRKKVMEVSPNCVLLLYSCKSKLYSMTTMLFNSIIYLIFYFFYFFNLISSCNVIYWNCGMLMLNYELLMKSCVERRKGGTGREMT